jgi:hypothetical protein
MIRIKLTDGETVETNLHTYEQAAAAKAANIGILVGGPDDVDEFERELGQVDVRPRRTIYPDAIGSIEEAR